MGVGVRGVGVGVTGVGVGVTGVGVGVGVPVATGGTVAVGSGVGVESTTHAATSSPNRNGRAATRCWLFTLNLPELRM